MVMLGDGWLRSTCPERMPGDGMGRISGNRRDAVRIITFRPQQFTKRGKQPVNFWSVFFNERLPKAGAAGESAVRTEFAGAFHRSKTVAQV